MKKIAVIGLGYVGLPLAVEFGRKRDVVGFDIDQFRIDELMSGKDETLETSFEELNDAKFLSFSSCIADLEDCQIYIVTVPTPVDAHKRPDLTPLIKASEMLGSVICKDDIIIYESTVFPGATEEECIPVVERVSGLKFNRDFFAGYSPERINPGDKEHRVTNILKITSGSTPEIATEVDELYRSIISAGTHKASSIRVAEAAKVIENTQRDVNIALINELSIIFNKLGIDTMDVLEAAGTKWNFLPFRPGLVGGHCIGVDPYYLLQKAKSVGYVPDLIEAARKINDGMGAYVADQLITRMLNLGLEVCRAKILIMGFSFKENCPDLRNTRVIDIVEKLNSYSVDVDVYDPWCDAKQAKKEHGIELIDAPKLNYYSSVIIAVSHSCFLDGKLRVRDYLNHENGVIYDLKSVLGKAETDFRL
jgi:UDP-N-acetyl-D-galactosamine dehydrogenase